MADGVPEVEPVEHMLDLGVFLLDEEVEDSPLHREPAAEDLALRPPCGLLRAARVGLEPGEIDYFDGEMDLQSRIVRAAFPGAKFEITLPEGDVAFHLFCEADASAAVHLFVFPFVSSNLSAKRSATAAMVRLGLAPTGPGMTEPSAMYSPGYPKTSP